MKLNLTRFHGVFVRGGPPPNSRHPVTIAPALRNKTKQTLPTGQESRFAQQRKALFLNSELRKNS